MQLIVSLPSSSLRGEISGDGCETLREFEVRALRLNHEPLPDADVRTRSSSWLPPAGEDIGADVEADIASERLWTGRGEWIQSPLLSINHSPPRVVFRSP